MGFLRVKLLQAEAGESWAEIGGNSWDPFCAIRIKEAVEVPGQGIQLVQKKKTIYPEWNKSFDTHVYNGRMINVAVMSRFDNKLIGDVTFGVEFLADQCRKSDSGVSSIWVGHSIEFHFSHTVSDKMTTWDICSEFHL